MQRQNFVKQMQINICKTNAKKQKICETDAKKQSFVNKCEETIFKKQFKERDKMFETNANQ